jgi:hypothetical protein
MIGTFLIQKLFIGKKLKIFKGIISAQEKAKVLLLLAYFKFNLKLGLYLYFRRSRAYTRKTGHFFE